jgi:ABC-type antimicrobial peptide transport system permease subunit
LNPWLSRKLNFGSDRLLVFEPKQIALLVIFLMFVTTIAGLLPARKASKLDPIEALRTE